MWVRVTTETVDGGLIVWVAICPVPLRDIGWGMGVGLGGTGVAVGGSGVGVSVGGSGVDVAAWVTGTVTDPAGESTRVAGGRESFGIDD